MEPEDRGEEGEEGGSGDDVTRRLLNLMAGFLEGEVKEYTLCADTGEMVSH